MTEATSPLSLICPTPLLSLSHLPSWLFSVSVRLFMVANRWAVGIFIHNYKWLKCCTHTGPVRQIRSEYNYSCERFCLTASIRSEYNYSCLSVSVCDWGTKKKQPKKQEEKTHKTKHRLPPAVLSLLPVSLCPSLSLSLSDSGTKKIAQCLSALPSPSLLHLSHYKPQPPVPALHPSAPPSPPVLFNLKREVADPLCVKFIHSSGFPRSSGESAEVVPDEHHDDCTWTLASCFNPKGHEQVGNKRHRWFVYWSGRV